MAHEKYYDITEPNACGHIDCPLETDAAGEEELRRNIRSRPCSACHARDVTQWAVENGWTGEELLGPLMSWVEWSIRGADRDPGPREELRKILREGFAAVGRI